MKFPFSWYCGEITTVEAEKHLMSKRFPTGTFIVWKTTSAPHTFSLSVRDEYFVKHYRICKLDTGGYLINNNESYGSLYDLVQHYRHNADELVCSLTSPWSKSLAEDSGMHCIE